MHGDARRAEDQQQNGHLDHAGRLPGRSENARRVPDALQQQVSPHSASIPADPSTNATGDDR